jgi:hypothetical protein
METTPICSSVEQDLQMSADELTAPRPGFAPEAQAE